MRKVILDLIVGLTVGHATLWSIYFIYYKCQELYNVSLISIWWPIIEIIAIIYSFFNFLWLLHGEKGES